MKESTFFLLFIATLFLIGIVGKLIRKESFAPNHTSYFDRLYRGSWLIIPLIFFIFQSRYKYHKNFSDYDRVKNHIPCIDSNMQLMSRTKAEEVWRSVGFKTDSVSHYKKIDIERTGIDGETDYFINDSKNQTLVVETKLPGLIRSRRINYKLLPTDNYFQKDKVDAIKLDSLQADSLMKNWNYVINYNCR